MTLNVTVVTGRCIYQSADFRLTDWITGRLTDFETQKILLTNKHGWTATVCFSGVGRTQDLNVGDWLAERVEAIEADAPIERLLDALLTADEWLSKIPTPHNRHSFSVGAFVGSKPVFALVSNFEAIAQAPLPVARSRLSVSTLRIWNPRTFVSGSGTVGRPERRRLAALAAKDPEPRHLFDALEFVNRDVARRNTSVSESCFTTYLRLTGESGGAVHGLGNRAFLPKFAFPPLAQEVVMRLLDEQFGPGRAQLRQVSAARSEPTDEYHELQIREKPADPNAHSNYGAFLQDKKHDIEGAEREYARALELDGNHVNALGNLANLRWAQGNVDAAEALYRKALQSSPQDEHVTYNFCRLLNQERGDRATALTYLISGAEAHPQSGRLRLLYGELSLLEGRAPEALSSFEMARQRGADQAQTESGYAIALQMNGASVGECIAAYRVALALASQNAALRINLAQLLFLRDEETEATAQLREALTLSMDDCSQMEVLFYQLAHTDPDPPTIFHAITDCLSRGGRLQWNVLANIERVRRRAPRKADLLETLRSVMAGELEASALQRLLEQWPGVETVLSADFPGGSRAR